MITSLQLTYRLLYPGIEINSVQRFVKQSLRLSFGGEIFGSKAASRDNNTIVTVHWPSWLASLSIPVRNFPVSVGQIHFFKNTTYQLQMVIHKKNTSLQMYIGTKSTKTTTGLVHQQ